MITVGSLFSGIGGIEHGLERAGGWECGISRVTKKQKNRVNRIKCLGNAVVPQCAEFFAEIIKEEVEK